MKWYLKNYSGAIDDFTKAIEIDPDNVYSFERRADFKRESGDPKGAIVDYDKALSIDPNYTSSIGGRGTAKSYLKDMDGEFTDCSYFSITETRSKKTDLTASCQEHKERG